jgi:photosystem II stability/assembly factor-like uncharacterized protein
LRSLLLLFALPAPLLAQEDDLARRIGELQRALEEVSSEMAALRGELLGSTATEPAARLAQYARHAALAASPAHSELAWQHLGPTNISGRVTDVAVPTPRGATYAIYVATASGGVWRTDNEGVTWRPIFEHAASTSVGALGLDPADHERLWVGTGEANIFRSSMAGSGVYLTRDGGETWEHKGLAGTHTIARIVVHPSDPDTVYVAASGHEWTDNEERGVYRTRDGGATWERVLFVDAGTGAIDLVLDASKPEVVYAATWERRRKRWNDPRNDARTRGSGVWRSDDGGDTWQAINAGLPAPEHRGRIGIDLARSNPSVVYAFVDNYEQQAADGGVDSYGRPREAAIRGAEVYRSDDRGRSWRKVSESNSYMAGLSSTYGWVFGQLRVDPTDEDTVYVMGLALNVSNDGGATFRRLRGMHADHHALWIDPANPRYLVNGNDGGIVVSYDGGARWLQHTDNLPAVQFYNVGYDMAEPFKVYGSIQDHGSMVGVVDLSRGRDRIRATEWERAPGGEASYHAVDPTDPDTLYAEGFYGSIFRVDLATGERARIAPRAGEDEPALRGQWLAPFLISPHNPRIVYHGMHRLFRSLDRGERFEAISHDLSRDDARELGDIPFQTIATIDESPLRFGLVYAGTDDGRLHVTADGGATWADVSRGLARERWISRVCASRYDADTVYCAQNGKRWDDLGAYLWRSRDRGATWTDLAAGLPGAPVNVVREDPRNPDVLYVGSDLGVYVSTDRGATWSVLGSGLPTTYVHDLVVHPRDDVIVIATHGRGMWALDARPVQGVAEDAPADEREGEPWGDEDEDEG